MTPSPGSAASKTARLRTWRPPVSPRAAKITSRSEINGSKGSLAFDFEDMNRLAYYNADDPADRRGFRSILVTEASQPYAGAWWPPGHIIGYEHTFVNAFADFVKAVVAGKSVQPTFADGLRNEKVLAADRRERPHPPMGQNSLNSFFLFYDNPRDPYRHRHRRRTRHRRSHRPPPRPAKA